MPNEPAGVHLAWVMSFVFRGSLPCQSSDDDGEAVLVCVGPLRLQLPSSVPSPRFSDLPLGGMEALLLP